MKKLSILICSLENRKHFLDRLLERLQPQLNESVEVLVKTDSGEMSIGAKRNELMSLATGEYVAFVDDDDLVGNNYVSKILDATSTGADCVGMEGIITFDGKRPRKFVHSIRYKTWFERAGVYYRNPNHLNPIKREIAINVPFPDINMGEDRDFSQRVQPMLQTEKYIRGPIYFYEFRTKKED